MSERTITDIDINILLTRFKEVFVTKADLEEAIEVRVRQIVKEEINHLPNKDEFYQETEKIHKRLNDLEEEKDILSHRVSKHSDQIEQISSHVGIHLKD